MTGDRTPPNSEAFLAQCRQVASEGGGWVYEIDAAQVRDPMGAVPPQAILGAWQVAGDGTLTGAFQANPNYRP